MSESLLHTIPSAEAALSGLQPPREVSTLNIGVSPWPDYSQSPETEVRLWYSSRGIHVGFRVSEEQPRTACRNHNEPVYEDSCVEFFLQPCPGTDPRYLNFEMNAAGALLLQLGTCRGDRRFLDPAGFTSFAIAASDPQIEQQDQQQQEPKPGWKVAYTIPFDWLGSLFPDFRPGPGWAMRGNFYKCGDRTAVPHYACWNPVTSATPDFHRSGDFGLLVLQ